MKKALLTIVSLAVAAAMVFSFSGCTKSDKGEEPSTEEISTSVQA